MRVVGGRVGLWELRLGNRAVVQVGNSRTYSELNGLHLGRRSLQSRPQELLSYNFFHLFVRVIELWQVLQLFVLCFLF